MDERRVIDIWCGLEQPTITWLLTTGIEDFERASIRKEYNSNTTCELTILILSVSVTFCVTFVWLLPCYNFHSKSVSAMSTIRPTRVFVLNCSAAAKSGYGEKILFYALAQILDVWCAEKILKLDSNCQSYSKCYRGTLIWLAVSRVRCVLCIVDYVLFYLLLCVLGLLDDCILLRFASI